MGFILQLASNGASRLLFMYLVAYLASRDAGYATPHAALLGYASSLVVLFGLNIYQHTIARNSTNLEVALDSCSFQFRLLLTAGCGLWSATFLGWLLGWQPPLGLMAALAGVGLAQSEVTFSMATARARTWRPLLYYGTQSIFFACYLLMVWQKMSVVSTVLTSVVPLFLINYGAYKQLQLLPHTPLFSTKGLTIRLYEYRERAAALLAQAPVVATVPALIYLMGRDSGQADQIPQLMLFISYAGAVVFILGNTYQFYGHSLVTRLLVLINSGKWNILLLLSLGVIASSLLLTLPMGLLLGWMKEGKSEYWPMAWYLSVGVFAAGTALSQWYSAICIGLQKPAFITISNATYFLSAVFIYSFADSVFYYILAMSVIVRFVMQSTSFSLRLGPA